MYNILGLNSPWSLFTEKLKFTINTEKRVNEINLCLVFHLCSCVFSIFPIFYSLSMLQNKYTTNISHYKNFAVTIGHVENVSIVSNIPSKT